MARARNIKPGFFKNEKLVSLPPFTRLLFVGLWTIADREGRLEDRPMRIKMEIFPCDDCDVDSMLDELASGDDPFLFRYERPECPGKRFIQIANWAKHQRPHHKESESEIPCMDPEGAPRCAPATTQASMSRADTLNSDTLNSDTSELIPDTLCSVASATVSAGADSPKPSRAEFVEAWNSTPGVAKIHGGTLTDSRANKLRTRLTNKRWWPDFLEALKKFPLPFVEEGRSEGWIPDADWILKPNSVARILEGKYHHTPRSRGDPRGNLAAAQRYLEKESSDG